MNIKSLNFTVCRFRISVAWQAPRNVLSSIIYLRSTEEQKATHIGLSVQKSDRPSENYPANIVEDVETANNNRETAVDIET